MKVIEISHLTKDYGNNQGVFDLNMTINKGEMIGYVGTNGSGKTTTIRHIMGFLKPTSGKVLVNGLSAFENSSKIVKDIGYVPGEIAFPDLKTGIDFLKCQADFLNIKDMSYANELIEKLQLDPYANLKRMSKGMKQKTALVAALMSNANIIILDEPTTGLDPLMRARFLEIIKEEHKKGKTILMSSHSFDELEKTCDKVVLINNGRIVDICDMNEINNPQTMDFKIEFLNKEDYENFLKLNYSIIRKQEMYNQVTVRIKTSKTSMLLKELKYYQVKFISEVPYTLERHFKNILLNNK